jgi:hypothetical protein
VRLAGDGGTPPPLETALAKTAANLAAKFVCDEAMQIHGGYGYSREYPLERAYRDIRGLCFGAGTVEAQRNFIGLRVAAGGRTGSPGWRMPADCCVGSATLQPRSGSEVMATGISGGLTPARCRRLASRRPRFRSISSALRCPCCHPASLDRRRRNPAGQCLGPLFRDQVKKPSSQGWRWGRRGTLLPDRRDLAIGVTRPA